MTANAPLIPELFFNGKDEFGGLWGDHKYLVADSSYIPLCFKFKVLFYLPRK